MQTNDIYRLITAIDLGDARPYHGDIRDGLLEALKELLELRETIESVEVEDIETLIESHEKLAEIKEVLGGPEVFDKPLTDSGESNANSAPLSTPK